MESIIRMEMKSSEEDDGGVSEAAERARVERRAELMALRVSEVEQRARLQLVLDGRHGRN